MEFKRYFLSPLFAPVVAYCIGTTLVNVILIFFPESVFWITKDWQFIDLVTMGCYALLFMTFISVFEDFQKERRLTDYWIYFFLTVAALARERGAQHWFHPEGKSAFKTRFFIDPNNPLVLKIVVVALFAAVLGAAAYVLCKHVHYFIPGFFRMDTLSWSIVSLGVCGVLSKFVDRVPGGRVGRFFGFELTVKKSIGMVEEVIEIFLPLIAIVVLWQYHLLLKDKNDAETEPEM